MDGEADREIYKEKLHSDLDSLVVWADTWQLKFHADKCEVLHLDIRNQKATYKMRKHGSEEKIDSQETTLEKDLGVHMDPELKFSQHLERQIKTANRVLGLIRKSFDYHDCDTVMLLFAALVRPHLKFGNYVWTHYLERNKKLIESVLTSSLSGLTIASQAARIPLPLMLISYLGI